MSLIAPKQFFTDLIVDFSRRRGVVQSASTFSVRSKNQYEETTAVVSHHTTHPSLRHEPDAQLSAASIEVVSECLPSQPPRSESPLLLVQLGPSALKDMYQTDPFQIHRPPCDKPKAGPHHKPECDWETYDSKDWYSGPRSSVHILEPIPQRTAADACDQGREGSDLRG